MSKSELRVLKKYVDEYVTMYADITSLESDDADLVSRKEHELDNHKMLIFDLVTDICGYDYKVENGRTYYTKKEGTK